MVGEKTWLGLIPGEERLKAYQEKLADEQEGETFTGPVYEDAPIMRPVVLMGPSSKDAEVSGEDALHVVASHTPNCPLP